MIRQACRGDIPQLVVLGEAFAKASQGAHTMPVDHDSIVRFAEHAIGNPDWINLVIEEDGLVCGVIIGLLIGVFFSNALTLQELVWYVSPGTRGGLDLLHEFENAARLAGATYIVTGDKPGFRDLSKVYIRGNYKLLERQFIKNLGGS